MALKIPPRTVEAVYRDIYSRGLMLRQRMPADIAKAQAVYSAAWLKSLVVFLRETATVFPRSDTVVDGAPLFSEAWKSALAEHANRQTGDALTTAAYIAAFDTLGDALRAALVAALAEMPVDGTGIVLAWRYAPDGAEQWVDLGPSPALGSALQAVLDATIG